jgi:predicted RNase H-like nuclease (RuvC/YqgF family)
MAENIVSTELESKVNNLQVEVSALKQKVEFTNIFYGKLDTSINRLNTLMEERREGINQDLKDVYKKIEDLERRLAMQMEDMKEQLTKNHEEEKKKLSDLDKWRWMVMGASVVVGWLISKMGFSFTSH